MTELFRHDPTTRFTGLAERYARCRPDYPAEAVAYVLDRCDLRPGAVLVDVGSGTGISSRLFSGRGLEVLGIEPNADMRAQAERAGGGPTYRAGRAEATGLPAGLADAVLSAQAFHWFEPHAALAEFHRLLRPGGWAILLWNERDESDPFTADYGAVLRSTPGAADLETRRGTAGDPLLASPLFTDAERVPFRHEQLLTEEGILGRAFSVSYAPRTAADIERVTAELRRVFARYQRDGRVRLRYETAVYTGRRSAAMRTVP